MTANEKQIWIVKRYGLISVRRVTLYVATVPIYRGHASGDGLSESDAMEALYKDLMPEDGRTAPEPKGSKVR